MRLLILGGTAMLGRELANRARARGLDVTCAARGTGPAPDGVDLVRVDRDDDDGLTPLLGRQWDTVIDLTRQPGHARRAVREIRAAHWVLVSSGNVYARFDRPEQPETADLLPPLVGDVMPDPGAYGSAKVACEHAVRAGHASWTVVRSGLIGGAGDASGRSGYYPWRFAHPTGPDVLVPPDPTFPIAVIDIADLVSWTLDCAERRVQGAFNATGPTTDLATVLDTARSVAGASVTPRAVPAETLARSGVAAWMGTPSLPLWLDDPDWRWFATLDTSAARREGLTTRPLAETLAAALAYEEDRTETRGAGLTDDQERALRQQLGG